MVEKGEQLPAKEDGIMIDAPLFGLSEDYTKIKMGTFKHGMPVTTLGMEGYETMFKTISKTISDLEGELVNYYIEEKEGPTGNHFFLILKGELKDGTFLTTGLHLVSNTPEETEEEAAYAFVVDAKPVFHWTCRGSICGTCQYDLNPNSSGCKCSFGINDCVKYWPGHDTN